MEKRVKGGKRERKKGEGKGRERKTRPHQIEISGYATEVCQLSVNRRKVRTAQGK